MGRLGPTHNEQSSTLTKVPGLSALTPACDVPGTEVAQRFLSSAFDSVTSILSTFDVLREQRRVVQGDIRGRIPGNEEDQLRAAVVFVGAGVDATLKRLIQDSLPGLLDVNDQAHSKLEAFAASRLGTGEIADTKMIARYLVSGDPRQTLIDDYVFDLTGSSLQSAEEVQKVAGALGIEDASLRRRISGLKDLFVARNQISHELDLQHVQRQGERSRRTRSLPKTLSMCREGLEVAQLIINAVGAMLPQ